MSAPHPARLVAITGGSGSGKTWLADRLQQLFGGSAGRLSQDSFYRDWSHLPPARRAAINFDDPAALDWPGFRRALADLAGGRASRLPVYDFATHCRRPEAGELVEPRPLMLVDGLWLLHRPEVRRLFHLRIFLQCPGAERLRRRVARDTVERGRSARAVRRQFNATVAPMHRRFVDPQARQADLVLPQPYAGPDLAELHRALRRLFQPDAFGPRWLRRIFPSQLQDLLLPAASLA